MRLEFPHQTFRAFTADLQPTDLVITASGRLARELRQRIALQRMNPGEVAGFAAVSQSTLLPTVEPYSAWLRDCWQRLRVEAALHSHAESAQSRLLSEAQEEVVWQRALHAAGAADRFLFLDETVAACRRSHELTTAFQAPREHIAWQRSEESRLFLQWLDAVQQECEQQGWLLQADFPDRVTHGLSALPGIGARRVFLAGFDEPTPQQVTLFAELARQAKSIAVLEQNPAAFAEPQVLDCVSAADAESEWLLAAQWARQQLRDNPAGRFVVVIPELAEDYRRVDEIFSAAFDDDAPWKLATTRRTGYHLSYAPPLAEDPLVQAGLRLLQALDGHPPVALLCYLLRSPWLVAARQEADARAALEATLLEARHDPLSLGRMQSIVQDESADGDLAELEALLDLLLAARRSLLEQPERSPAQWSAFVRGLWRSMLWQGPPSLTSEEYQARHRAFEELGVMAELQAVLPACSFPDFLRRIHRHFASVSFQPDAPPAPVLVAGLFEVSGLGFDAAWVCGLSDTVLPRPLAPDPFVPLELQRQHGLPRAATARERAFAEGQFARLLHLAPSVTLSYARRMGQEEQEPSPLLRKLGLPIRDAMPALLLIHPQSTTAAETIADWHGVALPTEGRPLRGGVRIFADQSACPFRAYAAGRLASDALASRAPLMDPRDQGSILHGALERFWRQTGSRASLCDLPDEERVRRVSQCVEDAIAEFLPRAEDPLAQAQKLAEAERLKTLLLAWLEEEQAREPFTVEILERSQQVELEGLAIRLRPDRVDRLADGSLALIDYKSGEVSTGNWLGQRPREPQLLLYLATQSESVSALAFASLRAGSRGWKLFGKEDGRLFVSPQRKGSASPPDGWADFVAQSRAAVTQLVQGFREGFAAVDPLTPAVTCRYCVQQPFCRIGESRGADVAGDGEDGEDTTGGGR